jgi:hypothetical protein
MGMSWEDLAEKWARAGGENKVREPFTPKYKRRRLGAKGIGRFSAGKLGRYLKLVTRARGSGEQLVLSLDFAEFTDDKDYGDIKITCKSGKPRAGFNNGTILEIGGLNHGWDKREVRKVRDQLCHLVDPDSRERNFSITFECAGFPDLAGPLRNPIEGRESHELSFSMDKSGCYSMEFGVSGRRIKRMNKETRQPLGCGPVEGVIRYYREGLKLRERALDSDTGETHMGVKVMRDGFRVRPYGEEGDDWLGIRSRRARLGGKYHVHPNMLAGTVRISATHNPGLRDATNRESGMIEDEVYGEFQRFVMKHIDIINDQLAQESSSESQKQRRQTIQKILDTVVNCVNRQESNLYKEYVNRIDRAKKGDSGQTITRQDGRIRDEKPASKSEWHCRDCDEKWRTLMGNVPRVCLEYAVNRKGELRNVKGCGSGNIEAAKHEGKGRVPDLGAIVSGKYALVGGKMVSVRVDYEMGENEDEYRAEEREIVVNGNHLVFRVAQSLDGMTSRKYEVGDAVFVPALTVHITKCVCLAWAELHFKESGNRWEEYRSRYETLQDEIYRAVESELKSG